MTVETSGFAIIAALLRQGRWLGLASLVAFAVALFALAMATGVPSRVLLLASIGSGLLQVLFAVRVGLDARIFEHLATLHPDADLAARLDRALVATGLAHPSGPTREWVARFAGARRLFRWQAVSLLAQVVTLCAALVL